MDRYNFYNNSKKPYVKRGLLSYLAVAIVGAVIGGLLVLVFAPTVLLEKVVSQNSMSQKDVQQVDKDNVESTQFEKVIIPEKTEEVPLVTAIAKKVMPAVVGIRTTQFRESMFYGRTKVEGVGSGVIVDGKGYILTNNHVADSNSLDITVYLADGRTVPARVIWTDEGLDLTILKINAANLIVAEIGDSDTVQIGELAVAIGNPLGMRFERSVTSGIISALNRTLPVDDEKLMEDLIQTDASINEGNSGGPLINREGKVIGINTVKVISAEGMGFAIPVNIVLPVIKSVVETGNFRTPYLGFSGLDKEIASLYNYKLDSGIYIEDIDRNGPAYKAGIRSGDIILKINDKEVNTVTALKQIIFTAGVGADIKIRYKIASGEERTVIATLDEARQ